MIPVNEPSIGERELQYVQDCVQSAWISSAGRYLTEFEAAWATYCGRQYGIATSNGTTALQVAARCLNLEPGDEVIIPSFTIISCALAVVYAGARPVLVDSEPITWCMDVRQVEEKISSRTRAFMPVHIYGHPVDMDPLLDLAKKYDLAIIEDAAEAHGARYKGRKCGGFGEISCFSFYANKIITTGEGGMVLTDDPLLAERAASLRNLCFQPRRFYHEELGYNFRLTNLQAAIGLAQLESIEEKLAKKRWIASAYTERLKEIPELQLPFEAEWAESVYWMYGIVLDEKLGKDASSVMLAMKAEGVETRPFFLGMHEQPVFQNMGLFRGERYPVAERIARQGFYLPSGLALTENQIDQVCEALRKVLRV